MKYIRKTETSDVLQYSQGSQCSAVHSSDQGRNALSNLPGIFLKSWREELRIATVNIISDSVDMSALLVTLLT